MLLIHKLLIQIGYADINNSYAYVTHIYLYIYAGIKIFGLTSPKDIWITSHIVCNGIVLQKGGI